MNGIVFPSSNRFSTAFIVTKGIESFLLILSKLIFAKIQSEKPHFYDFRHSSDKNHFENSD